VEGQIEIQVTRVQLFGFNLSVGVIHRYQHGVIALKLGGVLNPNCQRVKRVRADSTQVHLTNILGSGLIGPHGSANVQQQDYDRCSACQQEKSPLRT
jgi:hypothetical protein